MKVRDWHVGISRKGNVVRLHELDRKAQFWRLAEDKVCFCDLLRHEWLFKVPVGKPEYTTDDDGKWLENSLGSFLYSVENWIATRSSLAYDRCEVAVVPITPEQAKVLWPEWSTLIDDILDGD